MFISVLRSPRRGFSAGLLLVVLLIGLPQVVRADAALDAYNTAVGLQREKRWPLASEAFRRFLKDYPDHEKAPFAQMYLGLALINQEKYADARTVLREFVKAHPQSRNLPDAMYRVAECSYLMGDYPTADADFAAFVAQFPKHELTEWALPYLADAQLRQKKFANAEQNFRKSLADFPKGRMSDEARFGLARALDGAKKPDEAMTVYAAIARDKASPRAPHAQMQIGNHLYDAGKYAEAATAFTAIEQDFPEHSLVSSAQMNAGYAYYQAEKWPEAIARFDAAAKDAGQKPGANYWAGICLQMMGKIDDAAMRFQAVLTADPKSAVAERSLFQWAEMELKAGRLPQARERFVDFAKSFPASPLAEEALQLAADAAIREGQLDAAQSLVDRAEKEIARPRLKWQLDLVQARIWDARGDEANRQKAIQKFESILRDSQEPRGQQLSRLYLARSLQRSGAHDRVVTLLKPTVDAAWKSETVPAPADMVILLATSHLALKQNPEAFALASQCLTRKEMSGVHDQALSVRAIAAARLGKRQESNADLDRLVKEFADKPTTAQSLLDVAEAEYAAADYVASAATFDRLVRFDPKGKLTLAALSGLAWSEFQAEKFVEAAARFEELRTRAGDDLPRATEAAFMRGLCFQRADDLPKAAEAYASAWDRYVPKEPAAEGAEAEGQPLHSVFRSGWKAAQIAARLKENQRAERLYADVAGKFPKARERDKLLDDWALFHYEAENFARADELFRQLVQEYPGSDRAADARLNLAESDYVARRTDNAKKEFAALADSKEANPRVQTRALYNLVKITAEQRAWKELIAAAEKYRNKTQPGTAERAHVELMAAEAQLNQGDLKTARESLEALSKNRDALQKESWFGQTRILLAEAYCQLKEYDLVLAAVNEFRKEDPQSKVLHRAEEVLGRAYKNQAKFAEARSQFEKVINDPNAFRTETAAKCQFLIAETHLLQKDYRTAQIEYFKVEQLYKFPEWQSAALFQVAKCEEALNQWKDAVKSYEELLKKYPDSPVSAQAKVDLQSARKRASTGV